MMIDIQHSWRDPSGFICLSNGRVFRAVHPEYESTLNRLFNTSFFKKNVEDGSIPRTWWITEGPDIDSSYVGYLWLEHEALKFPCYPHELTAYQLFESAKLTLKIANQALDEGFVLKDASAWNVLFNNGRPVFCDILSFESSLGLKTWPAYGQFSRHFLIPLLIYRNIELQTSAVFLSYRDGISPELARTMVVGLSAYKQPAFELITLPSLLSRWRRHTPVRSSMKVVGDGSDEVASYILRRTFRRLERHLNSLKPLLPSKSRTVWGAYEVDRDHYNTSSLEMKRLFVERVLTSLSVTTVLDLGCNAGEFSSIAASLGKHVVAADFDDYALGILCSRIRTGVKNIQPVRLNVAWPTPALGFMNIEIQSFFDRAKGKFDAILMLGLIHHLIVSERIPLELILQMIINLNVKVLVIEWVCQTDKRFIEISSKSPVDYSYLTIEYFEKIFLSKFNLVAKEILPPGTRVIYCLSTELTQTCQLLPKSDVEC